MSAVLKLNASFPAKYKALLEGEARYRVFYGSRGSAKSWQFARALLIKGLSGGLRVLCAREVQSSIKESVHQLLQDQIKMLGLSAYYRVLMDRIIGPDGTLFTFKGLSDPDALKSTESISICWLEEANKVTSTSWMKLDPTIRKPGSEIWISFNPELETDYLYDLFVKKTPPPRSIVQKVTWRDNPWLSAELRQQKDHMRSTSYDDYLWVWEGHCKVALDGAVYRNELRAVAQQNRICNFGVVPGKPVHTFWDLGRSDKTAIWFAQLFGMEHRIVRYYENNGQHISHYIEVLEQLRQAEHYTFGTLWLPHDADEERLQSRRTTRQQLQDAEFKCKIVPKISVAEGIQAARGIFPHCYFHATDAADGIDQLRRYHFKVDEKTGTRSKNPEHDDSSNGADAFRYMGVALMPDAAPKKKMQPKVKAAIPSGRLGWLGR